MEDKTTGGLGEQQNRRKRIRRMKTSILVMAGVWILILSILCAALLVKVIFLENRMDELAQSAIAREQITQNHNAKNAKSSQENASDLVLDEEQGQDSAQKTEENEPGEEGNMEGPEADGAQGETETRKVYLTFDDGPSLNTSKILDILKEKNVKATFFVTGNESDSAKESYQRIVSEGHTLGMHSFSHKYDVVYQSLDAFIEDTTRLQSYLEEVTGVTPKIMRFPGGSSNQVSNVDMQELIRYVNEQGIVYYDWNVASGDATSQAYTPDQLIKNVMDDVVRYDTSIVLMHDSAAKPATVEALGPLIDQLSDMGAELLPIDEDTKPIQHITAESAD